MVLRKHQTSVRRYANGTQDKTCGPPGPKEFEGGEEDKRYSRFRAIDEDGIYMVGEKMDNITIMVNKLSPASTNSDAGNADLGLVMGVLLTKVGRQR
jgi:DNA-directed RNA polymerase III subunit RPC2